jgi:hypothetical protein
MGGSAGDGRLALTSMLVTQVQFKRELEVARGICRAWKKMRPDEYKSWQFICKYQAEEHEWTGGWSETKELLAIPSPPATLIHGIKHGLILLGWDHEEARFWDRTQEVNKWVPSKLFQAVVDELLPESKTVRKERIRRSFTGVESLPS